MLTLSEILKFSVLVLLQFQFEISAPLFYIIISLGVASKNIISLVWIFGSYLCRKICFPSIHCLDLVLRTKRWVSVCNEARERCRSFIPDGSECVWRGGAGYISGLDSLALRSGTVTLERPVLAWVGEAKGVPRLPWPGIMSQFCLAEPLRFCPTAPIPTLHFEEM